MLQKIRKALSFTALDVPLLVTFNLPLIALLYFVQHMRIIDYYFETIFSIDVNPKCILQESYLEYYKTFFENSITPYNAENWKSQYEERTIFKIR